MDLSQLAQLKPVLDVGIVGILCIYFIIQSGKDKQKLFDIIESNTKAIDSLKSIIERCQLTHKKD